MAGRMGASALAACLATLLLGACSAERSDEMIVTEIDQQLANSPVLGGARIEVSARGGVVTLDGVVGSEEQRARAESLAWGVEGVEAVESRLEVAASAPAIPPGVAAPPPAQEPDPAM